VRSYELIYIVHSEVDEAGLAAVNETVTGLVERSGGKVVRVDPWGLRRLAYPIQKMWEGQYVLMNIQLDPQGVTELERGLGLAEQILRHLLVRLEGVESAGVTAKPVESVEPVAETETTTPEVEGTEAEEPKVEEAEIEEPETEQAEPVEEPEEPASE
jgi:small subunit ribosomal protein S6